MTAHRSHIGPLIVHDDGERVELVQASERLWLDDVEVRALARVLLAALKRNERNT